MHELGLLYRVTKTVDSFMAANDLSRLSEIVLKVGEMTDVVPRYLEEAWQTVRDTTAYSDATLTVEVVPATAQCLSCGNVDSVHSFGMTCPKCDSPNLKIITGREFEIKHIVAK